jgi:hypothetical protein
MKYKKTTLLIGATILALGIILAVPVIADLEDDTTQMPPLYYQDEDAGEYIPWYDSENPESSTPPEDCPWWDSDGDGEFDWMPHWDRRWNNPDEDSWGYGGRRGGCGGYGSHFNRRYQTS